MDVTVVVAYASYVFPLIERKCSILNIRNTCKPSRTHLSTLVDMVEGVFQELRDTPSPRSPVCLRIHSQFQYIHTLHAQVLLPGPRNHIKQSQVKWGCVSPRSPGLKTHCRKMDSKPGLPAAPCQNLAIHYISFFDWTRGLGIMSWQ